MRCIIKKLTVPVISTIQPSNKRLIKFKISLRVISILTKELPLWVNEIS